MYFVGVQKPPAPSNGRLSCIDFVGQEICLVACKAGYEPEKPHANSYTYSNGQWSTSPDGYDFPWADCVAGKDTQPHFNRFVHVTSPHSKWRRVFETFGKPKKGRGSSWSESKHDVAEHFQTIACALAQFEH